MLSSVFVTFAKIGAEEAVLLKLHFHL